MDAGDLPLPCDLILDILRRLPGRDLAVSRCVCRSWHDTADAHALLLPHVFPREFPGIFCRYYGFDTDFALVGRPLPRDADEPAYRRLCRDYWYCHLNQHCNGLLLITGQHHSFSRRSMNPYVCNPATSRYARLPLPPTPWPCSAEGMFLAFDPAVSRHHEVFFFPSNLQRRQQEQPSESEEEKVLQVLVFSSRTGQWESREFTPGRSASGDLYDVVTAPGAKDDRTWWSAEYWRGSLYVHCHSGVLMILRCSQKTYDMIQLPRQPSGRETLYQCTLPKRYLASNKRGVCYAELTELKLEVWELTESADDRLGWTLAHEADLEECDRKINYLRENPSMQPRMQWEVPDESSKNFVRLFKHNSDDESNDDSDDGIVEDEHEEGGNKNEKAEEEEGKQETYNYDNVEDEEEEEEDCDDEAQGEEEREQYGYHDDEDAEIGSTDGSDYSWNSDHHNFIEFEKNAIPDGEFRGWGCWIVGFHPYKDMLFLKFSDTLVAYHLRTSRMQYLGYIYPYNPNQNARDIVAAFPYRPCYVDALPSRTSS